MRIGRTVPPAAAPLSWRDLWHGIVGLVPGTRPLEAREEELRREFGADRVFLVSSGSAALALALIALKSLSKRPDVIVPAYTCFSVPAAVLKAGLRPVPCDIDPATFDYDPDLLREALTSDTLGVVVHHLFGVPSDIARTKALCAGRGIFVIEDAAQAMGVTDGGRKLGTLGDVGIFSFGRGKNITCGGGGALLTSAREIAGAIDRCYARLSSPPFVECARDFCRTLLMTIFIRPRLYWIPASVPALRLGETIFPDDVPVQRMTRLKAGLLRGWRRRLAQANRIRSEAAARFGALLPMPSVQAHPYLRLPVAVSSAEARRELHVASRVRGLGLSGGYPTPVSDIPQVRSRINGQQFPAAGRVAEQLLTIPTHHWLTENDRRAIADLWQRAARA
jgi:dTDP-4-amino-4,6-dideoxygalactose transaminase